MTSLKLAKKRALVASGLLTAFGVIGASVFVRDWAVSAPLVALYTILVVNTYFSVGYFSKIISPKLPSQVAIDVILVPLHAILAATFANPVYFVIAVIAIFAVATLKYTIALPHVARPELLYRKIKIDALGTIAAILALCGIMVGYRLAATIALFLVFFAANIRVLGTKPLYPTHET